MSWLDDAQKHAQAAVQAQHAYQQSLKLKAAELDGMVTKNLRKLGEVTWARRGAPEMDSYLNGEQFCWRARSPLESSMGNPPCDYYIVVLAPEQTAQGLEWQFSAAEVQGTEPANEEGLLALLQRYHARGPHYANRRW